MTTTETYTDKKKDLIIAIHDWAELNPEIYIENGRLGSMIDSFAEKVRMITIADTKEACKREVKKESDIWPNYENVPLESILEAIDKAEVKE